MDNSNFVISLDFELYWGVRDTRGEEYFDTLKNVHIVIPQLLALFEKYDIACTWASVGALCAKDYQEFLQYIPEKVPSYKNKTFSPFNDLDYLSSIDDKLLFAPQLVSAIKNTKNQEFSCHTFSHYYALEQGQNIDEFEADLKACSKIVEKDNISLKSLIFPRNQFNAAYLRVCKKLGYSSYRGNPSHWAYKAENRDSQSQFKRAFRLLDAYFPLSGSLRQKAKVDEKSGLIDIPGSLFLRPWSNKLSSLEKLRSWRIKWSMSQAAKKGGIFHLWWHPHNFGSNMEKNLEFLEGLLIHYKSLNIKYNFQSLTMADIAKKGIF